MVVPIIPALNEDCIEIILSFVDAPTLVNVACTSRSAKAKALPILVRTVSLRMYNPAEIRSFCESVLHNRLARHIRRLTILGDESVVFGSVEGAMPSLGEIIVSTENLECLRIFVCAELLFRNAPVLRDSILLRPPSRSLELIGLTDWTWLTTQQLSGLQNLSLGLAHPTSHPISLSAFTTMAAPTLETMHLDTYEHFLSIRFTKECMPCPRLRMLSLAHMGIILSDLIDLGQAFPDLRYLRCDDLVLSRDSSLETLSANVGGRSQAFSKLVAVDAPIDVVELFSTGRRLRVLWIDDYIQTVPGLARLATVMACNSICSLELKVRVWVEQDPMGNDGILVEDFFAEICPIAPRLKYFSLTMDLAPNVRGSVTDPTVRRQREAQALYARAVAVRHLLDLGDLRCLSLTFGLNGFETYPHGEAEFATSILANLPHVEFFVLGPLSISDDHKLCLERPEVATTRVDGIDDLVQLRLDSEEVMKRLERYQFDISDASLGGAADWLASIRALDRVYDY